MRILLILLAALIVAGGTGFYVMQGLRTEEPEPVRAAAPAPRQQVYVAAQEIPIGTILTPDHLGRMPVSDGTVSPEMIVADDAGRDMLVGSVARQPLAEGVPIARSAVVQPGDRGFLAAVLPSGKRAITIPVDEVGSLSGLALPGDRVDVILTYAIVSNSDDKEEPVRASETVLSNLRVLAFDQRLSARNEDLADKIDGAPVAKTATLEVTSREAEVITLAQTLGTLSLVLNSVRDGADGNGTDGAAPGKLELTGGPRPAADRPPRLTLSSDVTSTSRVQVVRGVKAHATVPSPSADAAAAPAAVD
ncbi:MAG: Flp pilus assembly protein CpaB [Amaricoccus sp.]|uniref:Flp pilus assembly protein CpaB n=1 Tax=Amaricoccus sp. TaxID=1872485 RepID=UPI0039E6C5B0